MKRDESDLCMAAMYLYHLMAWQSIYYNQIVRTHMNADTLFVHCSSINTGFSFLRVCFVDELTYLHPLSPLFSQAPSSSISGCPLALSWRDNWFTERPSHRHMRASVLLHRHVHDVSLDQEPECHQTLHHFQYARGETSRVNIRYLLAKLKQQL